MKLSLSDERKRQTAQEIIKQVNLLQQRALQSAVHHPWSEKGHLWSSSHDYLSNKLPLWQHMDEDRKQQILENEWHSKGSNWNLPIVENDSISQTYYTEPIIHRPFIDERQIQQWDAQKTHREVSLFKIWPVIITMPSDACSFSPAVTGNKASLCFWIEQVPEECTRRLTQARTSDIRD